MARIVMPSFRSLCPFLTGFIGWIIMDLLRLGGSVAAQPLILPQPQRLTDQQGLPQAFVPAILQDRQGFIWMATRDGLCRFDGQQFKVFQPQPGPHPALSFPGIYALKSDAHGRLWILSEQADIDVLEPRTETFTHFSRLPFFQQAFRRYAISSLYIDRRDRLWVGLQNKEKTRGEGLVCVDTQRRRYRWFHHQPGRPRSLSSDWIKDVVEDPHGVIWVATTTGVDRFEPTTNQFVALAPPPQQPGAFGQNKLTTLFNGPTGELLIGSLDGVVVVNASRSQRDYYPLLYGGNDWWGTQFATDPRGGIFLANRGGLFHYRSGQAPRLIERSSQRLGRCLSLLVDHSQVLWLGTDGKGVDRYDLGAYPFERVPYQTTFQQDLLTRWLGVSAGQIADLRSTSPYMFRYAYDGTGALWLNFGSSTFYHIDLLKRQAQRVRFPVSFSLTAAPLATDEQGRVWALVQHQFWQFDATRQQWVRSAFGTDEKRMAVVLQVVIDAQAFWLATETNGLFRLDRRTGQVRHYGYQPNQPKSLSSNALLCLTADPINPNRLWIGTFGSGLCLFDKRSGTSQRLTTRQGLPNNVVYSALPDQHGYVWMGTNKGLCRLDARSLKARNFTREDGLLADEFNRFHALRLPGDGTTHETLIMAGLEGFTVFHPGHSVDDRFTPRVELTTLAINNRLVETASDSGSAPRPIQAVDQLRLPYNQNYITVGFAALQFNRPTKNRYRYRLDGLEEVWVETRQLQAIYTDLRPGHYTLWVNAANTTGQWSPYVRKLGITIEPPPWATWWAWLGYVLLGGALVSYGIRTYLARLREQQATRLQEQETEQLRQMDQVKSQFFANITHEFRTPLTLILSPAENLLEELSQTPYRKRIEGIYRSGQHLLGLINQLLDLAKLDAQALRVDESPGLLSEFVAQQVQAFEPAAQDGQIRLSYQSELPGSYWFDADKLTKILANLLSNALKFTPAGGQVGVELTVEATVVLRVWDTGVGLAADQLGRIFERFYQVDNSVSRPGQGTGIGLALVKELVELQDGHISVTSRLSQGTSFWIELPYRRVASEPTKPAESAARLPSAGARAEEPFIESASILVVEDNAELAQLISQSLPTHYQIHQAADGQQGLMMAHQLLPDLIVSDVLMPVLDGLALCERLKADSETSHIPLILLTAKAAQQSRLDGLSAGADEYLTKPFHPTELRLRVGNLLLRQQRLRAHYHQQLTQANGLSVPAEPPFVSQLRAIIVQQLDNPNFTTETLAQGVALSTRSLNRKLSALVDLSPVELIRTVRLQQAAQLLGQGVSVADAAYRVGFESASYFGHCFKELFGLTPSDYVQAHPPPA